MVECFCGFTEWEESDSNRGRKAYPANALYKTTYDCYSSLAAFSVMRKRYSHQKVEINPPLCDLFNTAIFVCNCKRFIVFALCTFKNPTSRHNHRIRFFIRNGLVNRVEKSRTAPAREILTALSGSTIFFKLVAFVPRRSTLETDIRILLQNTIFPNSGSQHQHTR